MLGLSVILLSIQIFYLSQLGETNPGLVYRGSAVTEFCLGATVIAGIGLIVISFIGWARAKPFWKFT